MNNEQDLRFKCPHCEEEIDYLNYTVESSENGTASPYKSRHNSEIEFDHNTHDSSWNGDPTYECPECGRSLNRDSLIQITPETPPKIEVPKEPEDAVESQTKIILKTEGQRNNAYDMSNLGLVVCDNKDCRHMFCPFSGKKDYWNRNKDSIAICSKCGKELNIHENIEKIITKTIGKRET